MPSYFFFLTPFFFLFFYTVDFFCFALSWPSLRFLQGKIGRPGIIIQTTHLMQACNIPLVQTTSKAFVTGARGREWGGILKGLPTNITSKHLVKSCQLQGVSLRSRGGVKEGGERKS